MIILELLQNILLLVGLAFLFKHVIHISLIVLGGLTVLYILFFFYNFVCIRDPNSAMRSITSYLRLVLCVICWILGGKDIYKGWRMIYHYNGSKKTDCIIYWSLISFFALLFMILNTQWSFHFIYFALHPELASGK